MAKLAPQTIYGMPICISDICDMPKMQVGADFRRLQTPELITETNAWMLKFFGIKRHVYKCQNEYGPGEMLVMSEYSYQQLQRSLTK